MTSSGFSPTYVPSTDYQMKKIYVSTIIIYIYISLFTIIMVAQKGKKFLQPKAKNASNTQQT